MKFGLKSTLALAALSMTVACGTTDDPSKNNANNANNESNQSNETNNASNEPNNESNQPNNESNQPNNTTSNNPNNTTSNNPNNTSNNPNNPPGPCMTNDVFFGQIDSTSDDHAGGVPTTDPLPDDAGLAGALGMFMAMEDMQQTVDPGIAISGATITATSFGDGGNSNFWVQDSGAAMQVRLGFMNPVDVTVKVGDIVSFTITEFDNFDGNPQISAITDFVVDSSGNPVPYTDLTGMVPADDQYNKIVRIGGRLSDTGVECGGTSTCFELNHGSETIEYRTSSDFIEGGECMTFFGPLGSFPGPNTDNAATTKWQLNTTNFSWAFELFED